MARFFLRRQPDLKDKSCAGPPWLIIPQVAPVQTVAERHPTGRLDHTGFNVFGYKTFFAKAYFENYVLSFFQ
jgi:hypothetical protein